VSLFYRSEYVNVTLAGRTRGGDPFALVTGKHSRDYPYAHPESGWDDVLVLAGGRALAVWGRSLAELSIELAPADAPRGRYHVRFDGRAREADGREIDLALSLSGNFVRFRHFQLAKPYDVFDLGAPGLRWQPFELTGGEGSWVAVSGGRLALEASFGELEQGRVLNVASRRFAFGYDYFCPAHAGETPYASVSFVSQAVDPTGLFGRLLDAYLRRTASATLAIEGGALRRGARPGAPAPPDDDPAAILSRHTIPLGYADLDRRLVAAPDAAGRPTFGLREVFTARPRA
jgi:hypothetical protein